MVLAEDNRKKIIDKIPEMRMIDDTFMSAVFDGQKEETALLFRIVLGKSDIEVMAVKAQDVRHIMRLTQLRNLITNHSETAAILCT